MEQDGFSLLEMLVAITIFGIIGTTATISLVNFLRSTSKTDLVKEIKQNGDYALSVMELKLRNAQNITSTCTGGAANNISFTNPDSTNTTLACDTSENVWAIKENTTKLTNNLVRLTSCSFTCATGTGGSKSVAISFTLTQPSTSDQSAESGSQVFTTIVVQRNY